MTQKIYPFGGPLAGSIQTREQTRERSKALLGGKGANLAEMVSIGLPVPPGFTITTEACAAYYEMKRRLSKDLAEQVDTGIAHIEQTTGKGFGDTRNPLLVSVRSGARVSMPGMMDTVLNLGLNDATVEGLAASSSDARFAWDSYRRFIHMYAVVVMKLDHGVFEEALEIAKEGKGFYLDTEMSADDWRTLVGDYKELVRAATQHDFPQQPREQLHGAIGSVFTSWESERAKVYRRLNAIPSEWGTAVTVQAMIFGNMGSTSATGVAFTRDPATGERAWYGEWLMNAQGEDVVAGIRTPQYLTKAAREKAGARLLSMEEAMPTPFAELSRVFDTLERHYRDMQDIEFTIECGKLWMLQTRSGKRTAKAALKIAVDMVAEGLIDEEEAVLRIDPGALEQLLHPTLDPSAPRDVLTRGLPASPGAATGKIRFDADSAERAAAIGEAVILVRLETSPEDIHGMHAACGILTARGGMTSHAAVVARGMGRPCVSGAGSLMIDTVARVLRVGTREWREGDVITVDGSTGDVIDGEVPTLQPELVGDFGTVMEWADKARRMHVRTNAETPNDTKIARDFGAEGIGLCRTEHMFFDAARIAVVREMILADSKEGRLVALSKLIPEQRRDFAAIFEVMVGLPVTIRLLDPPLHEFLPTREEDFAEVSRTTGVSIEKLKARADELHEFNPMLGHRGCRLGVTFPEIYAAQTRAIFEASCDVAAQSGVVPLPEIMIPLVATKRELDLMKAIVNETAATVFAEKKREIAYLVGTMIELPRAALMAGEIAHSADFFSFGTNDLTQTTIGISRDDAGRFLTHYVEKGIFSVDPFVSLDTQGVGQLIALATERGRTTRRDIKLGICGEHGGDPPSIDFCEGLGLDYVSTSPYRVPIARLAAAQATLRQKRRKNDTISTSKKIVL